jgi:modification methylase
MMASRKKKGKMPLTEIPSLARSDEDGAEVFNKQYQQATIHELHLADSRNMSEVKSESVHLIVTSPPYWILKKYNVVDGQLGSISEYQLFLEELGKVIGECFRVLVKGGRFICVIGDVCRSRKENGEHMVVPLHSDVTMICRNIGFDNLTPIIWYKIANACYEANTKSTILGKPYEPNAVIKNDIEFILMQRKPGSYRKVTDEQRLLSYIPRKCHEQWFKQIWDIKGESTRKHPAPFPIELALRLVRMYSFVGDTILDPFLGTGTTTIAALEAGRNSIGYEIDPSYLEIARIRAQNSSSSLFWRSKIVTDANASWIGKSFAQVLSDSAIDPVESLANIARPE